MDPFDTARARSRAYALFGRLYREGPMPGLSPALCAVPELADALGDGFDADAAAADHHHLFRFNVFPYASVFLDASGRLGGPVTDHVRRTFRSAGFDAGTAEPADHAGHQLAFLAFLTGAEADAWQDERPDEAGRVRRLQRRFFDAHLLWWLPAFTWAVHRQDHPFYTALAGLTLDLVLDHRAALEGPAGLPAASPLPDPPGLLDDEKTGLREIAAYLATPAWSGLYLSRDDLARLSHAERLPRGFGGRALMLTNLLRAAVAYDRLDPLLALLAGEVQAARARYAALARRGVPALDAVTQAWRKRLEITARMIDRIRTAAALEDTGTSNPPLDPDWAEDRG